MSRSVANADTPAACRLILRGAVQGIGVRPAIHRLAVALELAGCVRNTGRGVEIEVQGRGARVEEFVRRLPDELPAMARLDESLRELLPVRERAAFVIERESATSSDSPLATRVPADRAVCDECLGEVHDPADRRHGYAFTSCTQCGPRFTAIRAMPYERDETTFADFRFCPNCQAEYDGPASRRFHAQTNACPVCGPKVWCVDRAGDVVGAGNDAIRAAAAHLLRGCIIALRGIGGYQLLVDATDQTAVQRLRERKRRPSKPLAVMAESREQARRLAKLDGAAEAALTAPANPIVLLPARADNSLAPAIHPGLNEVGLLLPTSPLHDLLLRACGRPVVCTSGNREGEPLEFEPRAAEQALADIADVWLHHDRPIARAVDDSVLRMVGGRAMTIRLARGLAPLPLPLPAMHPTLAVGGYLKSAMAWSNGVQAVLGPHVGDLETVAARQRWDGLREDLQRLYRFQPGRIVHDLHPGYFTTERARQLASRQPRNGSGGDVSQAPLETLAVQHHHAHVAAVMLEHGWLDREVLGIAWDGTGYGWEGTIWGGEVLVARAGSFERLASLRPFRLPGGEAAIRTPWRTAVMMLNDAAGDEGVAALIDLLAGIASKNDVAVVRQLGNQPRFSPRTTSAGRLFDVAAVLTLGLGVADFDGQLAMRLEALADRTAAGAYPLPIVAGSPHELDWRPLVRGLLADRRAGVSPSVMAMRFHRALAEGLVAIARRRPALPVVLAGGTFQNRLLAELVRDMLEAEGRECALAGTIPPNDGGLAAGQLAIAAARFDHGTIFTSR